ncbi:MAG: hypothetical protein CBB97_26525 [Candidatus Endolissoclinum sp. TMED37]|nr:MAG: hypothetical protein CBB97_26525 [Candidatus Endolissoclinum sp. TMED37]
MDSRTVTGPIDRLARLGAGFFLPVVLPVKQARASRAVAASKRTASRGPRPVVPDPQPAIRARLFFLHGSDFWPRFNFQGPRSPVPGSGSPGQSRLIGCSDPSAAARDPARPARAWQTCTCAGFTQTIHNKNQRSTKGL